MPHASPTDPGPGPNPPRPQRIGIGWFSLPPMRYPNAYVWFIFFSAMDVMLTWRILRQGGEELNPVARHVLEYWSSLGEHWDLWVALGFKFCLMLFVIIACEVVGRKRHQSAMWLARVAVVISACPVVYTLSLLTYYTFFVPRVGGG